MRAAERLGRLTRARHRRPFLSRISRRSSLDSSPHLIVLVRYVGLELAQRTGASGAASRSWSEPLSSRPRDADVCDAIARMSVTEGIDVLVAAETLLKGAR